MSGNMPTAQSSSASNSNHSCFLGTSPIAGYVSASSHLQSTLSFMLKSSDSPLVGDVQQVGVGREGRLAALPLWNGDASALGVVDQLGAAGEIPLPPGGDHLDVRLQPVVPAMQKISVRAAQAVCSPHIARCVTCHGSKVMSRKPDAKEAVSKSSGGKFSDVHNAIKIIPKMTTHALVIF